MGSDNVKVSERTIINKIFKGIENNGWSLLNGLGSGTFNDTATQKSMVQPLIEYLKKNGVEVGK